MAIIYLKHPKHGVKVATMEMEAQYDEQNGWVRFDPDEPDADNIDDDDLPEIPTESNVFADSRRKGRTRLAKGE